LVIGSAEQLAFLVSCPGSAWAGSLLALPANTISSESINKHQALKKVNLAVHIFYFCLLPFAFYLLTFQSASGLLGAAPAQQSVSC